MMPGYDMGAESLARKGMEEAIANLTRAPKPYSEPRAAMRRILEEIAAERTRQDEKWGGPGHDDEHGAPEWTDFIDQRTREACDAWGFGDDDDVRRAFIEIAALAVAAVESLDRKAGR